jgi:UDP:flavonoid glycosyltransferase YjiC (YdhE family)
MIGSGNTKGFSLALPTGGDVNARVEWSGAGIDLKTNTPTAEALAKAVRCVLNQPRYRSSAAQLATEFAKLDARQEVIRIFDELACAVSHIHQE